jgi:hypothetical protein
VVVEKSNFKPMIIAQIESQISYVTNVDGETTDVIIPVELWQQLVSSLSADNVNDLACIDE